MVSTLAAVAIAVHLIWPGLKIDLVAVALLVFGCLPWLRGIVKSISLPGGPSIEMHQYRARVIAQEERETSDAIRAVGSNTVDPPNQRIQEIQEWAQRYEAVRHEMPSGHARTREMGRIAREILSLLPAPGLDPSSLLRSPEAGDRLTAYLALMAEPDAGLGENLIETLTEREGIPYNQSWALRALGLILEHDGRNWVSPRSLTMLTGMRDGLRQGSDRQLTLANLVERLTEPTRIP